MNVPGKPPGDAGSRRRALMLACGALVPEIQAVLGRARLDWIDLRALPASLHNRPDRIAPAVAQVLGAVAGRYDTIFVAYGDCGTGGDLDRVLRAHGAERLPGAHCYQFFSGVDAFAANADEDLTAFFLTDFLARHFDTLVIRGLGLDRHPELLPTYFAHYERVVYLSQAPTPDLLEKARTAAATLGLAFEHRPVGYGDLARVLDARFPHTDKERSLTPTF